MRPERIAAQDAAWCVRPSSLGQGAACASARPRASSRVNPDSAVRWGYGFTLPERPTFAAGGSPSPQIVPPKARKHPPGTA